MQINLLMTRNLSYARRNQNSRGAKDAQRDNFSDGRTKGQRKKERGAQESLPAAAADRATATVDAVGVFIRLQVRRGRRGFLKMSFTDEVSLQCVLSSRS